LSGLRSWRGLPRKGGGSNFARSERREPRILIGTDAYQIDILQRLRPASYWKTLAKILEDPSATNN